MRHSALPLTLLAAPLVGCMLVVGCSRPSSPQAAEELLPEHYGKLPGLKGTPNKELQDELGRIREQGGTPEQLSDPAVAEADNVAAGMRDLFPRQRIRSILKDSEEIFPPARKDFDLKPTQLQRAIRFRTRHDAQRVRVRKLLARPQCNFGIQFLAGSMADLTFVDVVRICGRLEAFCAAEALDEDRADPAIDSLQVMLRLARYLAAEKHYNTRIQAAYLRTEAFGVLKAIVAEDRLSRNQLDRLYEMVRLQLESWPSDAGAWIGERAVGLHAYEMVRDGRLLDWLGPEIIELSRNENVNDLAAAARRSVNQDELYYLKTMRAVIDRCRQPYYQRIALFDTIVNELQELRNSSEFPLVAARFLLPGVQPGHQWQAHDRANWEAWTLALASATGRSPPPNLVNPLTGEHYQLTRQHDPESGAKPMIVVANFGSGKGDDNPIIEVPDLADAR